MAVTLNGWQQIAAFLRQTVKTAKSWEQEGMPIHRAGKGEKGLVFAFPAELIQWIRISSGSEEFRSMPGYADQPVIKRNRELRSMLRQEIDRAKRHVAAISKSLASTAQHHKRASGRHELKQQGYVNAAVADMSRKLVEAQEQERTRIARELHDDVSQRLALVAIAMDEIEQKSAGNPELLRRIAQTKREFDQIRTDVQALSHELHSTRLEILGIGPAMKGLCRDVAERWKVPIDFETVDVPSPVPWSIALCLYRVLQECLHNALKYSQASRIQVQLRGTSGELHLVVSDSGVGFNAKRAGSSGLGLTSIRERVRLEGGTVIVTSKPKHGTTIHACVPLLQSSAQSA